MLPTPRYAVTCFLCAFFLFAAASQAGAQVMVSGSVSPGGNTTPSWSTSGLTVGVAGNGQVTIQSGGSVTDATGTVLGYGTGTIGTMAIQGGNLQTYELRVGGLASYGQYGEGHLIMNDGAQVTGPVAYVSTAYSTLNSSIEMSGASTMNISGYLFMWGSGSSTVSLSEGSRVTASAGLSVLSGSGTGRGLMTVDDSTFAAYALDVGAHNSSGQSKLVVQNDGQVNLTTGLRIGVGSGAKGRVEVLSGDITLGANKYLYVGTSSGAGEMLIGAAGAVTAGKVFVGDGVNATGSLVLDGGTMNVADLVVINGKASMLIQNGGALSSLGGTLTYNRNSGTDQMLVDVADGSWTMTDFLAVGSDLIIRANGSVSNVGAEISTDSNYETYGATASATVDGGTWNNSGVLTIATVSGANRGTQGSLTVLNGGTVSNTQGIMAVNLAAVAEALVDGGTWNNTTALTVAKEGQAKLTVANGGIVNVAAGTGVLTLGETLGTGTLNIGRYNGSDNAGIVQAAEVHGGAGIGYVNFNQVDAITFAPAITGNISVYQRGTGTTVLDGVNTYTGSTSVKAGTLQFARPTALYNGNSASWTADKVIVEAGATAAFNVGGASEFTSGDIDTLKSLGTATGGFQSGSFLGFDTTNAAGGVFIYNGNLADTNGGANALGLTKLGAGVLQLGGVNTYTGDTRVEAGTLRLGSATALSSDTTLHIADGASFDANGYTQTVTSLAGGGSLNIGSGGLTLNQAVDTTFTGTLTGTGGLSKNGGGVFVLTGNSSFSGPTDINAGKLVINGSLAQTMVTIADGAALGGAGTLGGLTTITMGGHLAPGNSPGTLTFAGGLTLADGSVLDFELGTISDRIDVTGGTLTGPGLGGLVTLNLSEATGFAAGTYNLIDGTGASLVGFTADNFVLGTTISGYTYDLVLSGSTLRLTATAVPEPANIALLAGAAVGLALVWHRRRRSPAAGE